MKREWKPGDVALLTTHCCGNLVATKNRGASWHAAGGIDLEVTCQIADARPLVVIDPEDPKEMDRFLGLLRRGNFSVHSCGTSARDYLAAALREFANPTPPKPEEPTGLGAVVEDGQGLKWVRLGQDLADWYSDDLVAWRQWGDISAVRVLSEGVQA